MCDFLDNLGEMYHQNRECKNEREKAYSLIFEVGLFEKRAHPLKYLCAKQNRYNLTILDCDGNPNAVST